MHSATRQAGRRYSRKSQRRNDAIHFLQKQVFLCLLFQSFLPRSLFTLLSPSPFRLSLSACALMSQAHCAERSGSDVSVLLALNSRDGRLWWQSLYFLFFFLVCSLLTVSTLTAFITLNIIILWKKRDEKTDEMGDTACEARTKKKVEMKWLGEKK